MIPGLGNHSCRCGCAASFSDAVDRVGSFGALLVRANLADALGNLYRDPLPLFQPGKEPAHRMLRPAGRLGDLRHRRALRAAEHGRALSPTHTRKQGRLYRYYVSQSVLKGGADDAPYRRLPAGEIEALVLDQLRALLRQPEVVVGTWRAAQTEAPDLAEDTVRDALARFDPVWSELFPAEQERLIRLLVQRVVVGEAGAQISLNLEGLASLARDLSQPKRIAA